ncbi:unnamed protein product [Linum tenue]|uniref:Peptidase S74 domain-containing protein n=1 Tax=Linum tenue TaxID=586396 RepID=A0AAV0QN15_9ROSI|nr:unnamed protein product [Linum tenue]
MTSAPDAPFVLDSNNLWLVGNPDGTIAVLGGPDVAYLNTRDVTGDVSKWAESARIGTTTTTTHRSLELFGVVFSGQTLEELRKNLYDHQVTVNREGFAVQWLNLSGGDEKAAKEGSLYRRLNDLFDWSVHGVKVPAPVKTEWDRYQLGTGELMAEVSGLAQLPGVVAELEEENQALRDEKDVEIRELKKGGGGGGKDKMIAALRDALKLFL